MKNKVDNWEAVQHGNNVEIKSKFLYVLCLYIHTKHESFLFRQNAFAIKFSLLSFVLPPKNVVFCLVFILHLKYWIGWWKA